MLLLVARAAQGFEVRPDETEVGSDGDRDAMVNEVSEDVQMSAEAAFAVGDAVEVLPAQLFPVRVVPSPIRRGPLILLLVLLAVPPRGGEGGAAGMSASGRRSIRHGLILSG